MWRNVGWWMRLYNMLHTASEAGSDIYKLPTSQTTVPVFSL